MAPGAFTADETGAAKGQNTAEPALPGRWCCPRQG